MRSTFHTSVVRALPLVAAATLAVLAVVGPAGHTSPGPQPGTGPSPNEIGASSASGSSEIEHAEHAGSPRASLRRFLELTARGDHEQAARHLKREATVAESGPELARRLRAVLDRHVVIDLAAISPRPEGNREDGLPAATERVATLSRVDQPDEPLYMVRAGAAPDGPQWVFSDQTVERIDAWYADLADRWIRDVLPEALQQRARRGKMLLWQWLALPLLLLLAWGLGRLLGVASNSVLRRALRKTAPPWKDRVPQGLAPILTLLWSLAGVAVLLPFVALPRQTQALALSLVGAALTLVVFWSLWRGVDLMAAVLAERAWASDNPSARSLLAVTRNLLKAALAVGGVVATVAAFGYPVATVLAGLGIGGIALAFGAQKTVENLFGSVSLAADQPFRVGDFVRIEDLLGTVETIGLRSTRIRTLDRTMVTIPNGKLADMRIETFAARDRIRLSASIGLVYDTSLDQMRRALDGFRTTLREHPRIWPDVVVVHFAGFGASSLDVEVMCWFQVTDFNEFRVIREEVLLRFMQVVEEAGTSFAFPTRTVYLKGQGSVPGDGAPSSDNGAAPA